MCVFEFVDKEITLTKINPDYSIEDVKDNTGFLFKIAHKVNSMLKVEDKNKILLEKLDPYCLRSLEVKEEREKALEKFR